MKAIVLTPGTTNVMVTDWQEPTIQAPDEVKIKVLEVGICGTDREETSGGRADAPKGEKELIIGHEMLGKIVEVGKSVKNHKVGDLVVVTVRRGCGSCTACKTGSFDMCYTGNYKERGIKGLHGFQSEYVVDKEEFLIAIPSSIESIAVLTEPMSVVEKAIDEACHMQISRLPCYKDKKEWLKGKRALVAGMGPIGLLAAIILRLRGAEVLGIDIVDENSSRPTILKELGGTYINSKKTPLQDILSKYQQIDLIVEAAGIPKLDFDLINILGMNGIYVLTGVPGLSSPLNVDGAHMMKQLVLKNQVIFGSVNAGRNHFAMGVEDLEAGFKKWPSTLQKIITKKVSYKNANDVLSHHTSDEIKVVVNWHL